MVMRTETYYNPATGEDEDFTWDDGTNDSASDADLAGGADPALQALDFSKMYDWNVNADGSKQKVEPDGSVSYQDPDGSTYKVKNGVYTTQSGGQTWNYDTSKNAFVDETGKVLTNAPTGLLGKVVAAVRANPLAVLGTTYGALRAVTGGSNSGGYNVPIPEMNAVREQIEYNDPNRRAGSGGRQYVTDTQFVKKGNEAGLTAAQNAVDAQKEGILAAYKPVAAPAVNPWAGKMKTSWNAAPPAASTPATNPNAVAYMDPTKHNLNGVVPTKLATGGIAELAKGGAPRYLQGETDGMADEIPSRIDGGQEAALSHGEFVIPADVVSHLGNGNSDAGAKKLYQMMDRIRQARTGTKQQGKKINPDKFMPGGLAAAYANGGAVQNFDAGGGVPLDTSKTSGLSPWAGDYVTNMLGKTQALASTPTAVYGGPLTAGASNLQQQGFAGISDIASAGFDPTKFSTGTFDASQANKYMNPYLSNVLNPQLAEMRRQNDITNMGTNAKLTSAGAYGGGRQAIMNAENNRNFMQEANKTVGTGYANAFDKAMAQFNTEQGRQFDVDKASEASRQFSADYGLKTANDLLQAGAAQRGIESEGIAADKKQFEEQQADPYNRLEFQRKMLTDLPIGTTTNTTNQDAISKMSSDISGLAALYDKLKALIPST